MCLFRASQILLDRRKRRRGKKKLIHHWRVKQRNSTLPTVRSRDVWMCKSSSFASPLCHRWFTPALRRIAGRCLGEAHNGSMYCRINGALIWLVGHVCVSEGGRLFVPGYLRVRAYVYVCAAEQTPRCVWDWDRESAGGNQELLLTGVNVKCTREHTHTHTHTQV